MQGANPDICALSIMCVTIGSRVIAFDVLCSKREVLRLIDAESNGHRHAPLWCVPACLLCFYRRSLMM